MLIIYYMIFDNKIKRENTLFLLYIIGRYQNYTNIFCSNPCLRCLSSCTLLACKLIKLSILLKKFPIFLALLVMVY